MIRGIEGLTTKEPVGAVVTVGRKARKQDKQRTGVPIETSKFFVMLPDVTKLAGMDGDGARPQHPSFVGYNVEDDVNIRRRLRGRLVHATAEECWHYERSAYQNPQKGRGNRGPKSRRPFCRGNGIDAVRLEWDENGENEYETRIPCPGDRCQFAQGTPKPACGPKGRLLFQIVWDDGMPYPTPLVKWASGSWNSVQRCEGMFRRIAAAAEAVGIAKYSLVGFEFEMTLVRKSKDGKNFPVVTFSPLDDPVAHFIKQRQREAQLLTARPPGNLLTGPETHPRVIDADVKQNIPGTHADLLVLVKIEECKEGPDGEPVCKACGIGEGFPHADGCALVGGE